MSTTQSIYDEAPRDFATNRATVKRRIWPRLLGKELKQLAPLVVTLLGCGVLLHLLGLLQENTNRSGFHATILTLIPVLFAVGVGPLLVSQEKEQRTLRWMASLPVPPWSIVVSKLIVSMLGLIFTWCISLAITLVFCPSAIATTDYADLEFWFWPANTFLILTMGFALAWIFPTAGSTLVALLFSAIAAGVFAILATNGSVYSTFLGYLLFFQALVTAVLLVAAIWFGNSSFVTEAKSKSSLSWLKRREHSKVAVDRTQTLPLSPASGLIWQVGWQNRMLWVGALFIGFMGLGCLTYGILDLQSQAIMDITPIAGCLVLSWLGASVFGSDANHGRIRFLAERGISPFKIWWTRLALPLSCIILGLLVFCLLLKTSSSWHDWAPARNMSVSDMVWLCGLLTFGLAQWLPQWTRSTLIAFCVAPVLSIISLVYVSFMMDLIGAPWWLLVVSVCISFAATRLMLRPWMDGRTGLKYWLAQSALLIGAIALPMIPFLITFATYPDMPAALRQELTEEAKQYEPSLYGKRTELVIPKEVQGDTTNETGDKFIGLGDSVSDLIVALDRQLSTIEGPIAYSYYMRVVIKEAQLMSLRMSTNNDQPEDGQQQYRDRYHSSLVLLSKLAIRMRMSESLFDQEVADQIERWIVNELLQPGRKELFSDQEYSTMVAALADQIGRYQSRRRAVVVAWYGYSNHWVGQGQNGFGGLNRPTVPMKSIAASRLVAERNVGRATAALLEYLESEPSDSARFPTEIAAFWPAAAEDYEWKVTNADANSIRTPTELWQGVNVNSIRTPGVLWHQDWETKAVELNESLK